MAAQALVAAWVLARQARPRSSWRCRRLELGVGGEAPLPLRPRLLQRRRPQLLRQPRAPRLQAAITALAAQAASSALAAATRH